MIPPREINERFVNKTNPVISMFMYTENIKGKLDYYLTTRKHDYYLSLKVTAFAR